MLLVSQTGAAINCVQALRSGCSRTWMDVNIYPGLSDRFQTQICSRDLSSDVCHMIRITVNIGAA